MALGAAALALLALFAAHLLPPYWRNQQFQRALGEVASRAVASQAADEVVRVAAVNAAARAGIAIRPDRVTVRRTHQRLEIQVLYEVPVELPLYSVDLHFRPRVRAP